MDDLDGSPYMDTSVLWRITKTSQNKLATKDNIAFSCNKTHINDYVNQEGELMYLFMNTFFGRKHDSN